ncbi:MAG: DedA family protein [Pseudomonadales bacterium]|nr:DedA family protein [Pseudomonadales bacterium]
MAGWEIPPEWGLGGLVLSAFLSSTLLPGSSELVLLLLARQGSWQPQTLLWIAALANTLGAMTTYGVGRLAAVGVRGTGHIDPDARALARLRRWGYPALLLSWVPLIGDALCLAAGWLRLRWLPVAALLWAGKFARYGVLLWLVQ